MQKIRLDLNALEVVSFATDGEREASRGTVHGQQASWEETACGSDFYECNTNEYRTCHMAGPSVGPSCDYVCFIYTIGCYPETAAETCAETCAGCE